MEPGSGKKKEYREITYQVGWKKGKIEWNEKASIQSLGKAEGLEEMAIPIGEKRLRLLWRAAPSLPDRVLLPILYALPVVCFILTIVLVYNLRYGA
ncbi:hypothetical protein [Paenibacillus sedimenti]|uniref:Uncharacterized protein n=1 Tax=Paenibacillus sedimenti TaxID=2770274 RepID=A0A926KS21_9BACL|nr:hypothetical protein [Paenibacillus sedimenti]MBD0381020.1 hypothetical protein [Paenibacillus sedimenti]